MPIRPAKIQRPILCLVVDRQFSRLPIEEAISEAVRGGVDWIQLRDRQLEGKDWLAWASRIAQISRGIRPEVDILVNRRLDVAWAINAAGVHLGFDAVGPGPRGGFWGTAFGLALQFTTLQKHTQHSLRAWITSSSLRSSIPYQRNPSAQPSGLNHSDSPVKLRFLSSLRVGSHRNAARRYCNRAQTE